MQSHTDKLAEKDKCKKERKAQAKPSHSSFSGFSSLHATSLMVSELSPRPDASCYQDSSFLLFMILLIYCLPWHVDVTLCNSYPCNNQPSYEQLA